ncbi:MAG: carboxypeptidase-like regulatory domain-containing protein [Bacteroidota bacterium]
MAINKNSFLVKNRITKQLCLVFFLIVCFSAQAQQELFGKVSDSLGNPLQNANVIAKTIGLEENKTTFSITDAKGNYKIDLKEEVPHQVKVTYLGFKKATDTLQISEKTEKNYTLFESTESLDEVVIKKEMAMIVKEDTITYKVDNFRNGTERKLRDLLKNLPNVEVDRQGNVKVNGKKVKKLTIEGREFFTGDPKLGVNNIPADAVDEIDALDNDPEVAFLKGFDDSSKMTLNVKLKEDKKNFAFGESEVGGGHQDRYYVNPNVFYYSPNTSINILGDFNNIGESNLGSSYRDFEGGFSVMTQGRNTFKRSYAQDMGNIFGRGDFVEKSINSGGGNISQRLGEYLFLDAFSTVSGSKVESQSRDEINYFTSNQVNETREQFNNTENLASLSKIKLQYDNVDDVDFIVDFVVKYLEASEVDNTTSTTQDEQQFITSDQNPKSLEVANTLSFNKKFSYKHRLSINTNLAYLENENVNDWLFNQPVLTGTIPFEDEETINFMQHEKRINRVAQVDLKHYWVLNNTNHIYPIGGINFLSNSFSSLEYQNLEDGSRNNFQEAGFNNDLDFRLADIFGGFQYKAMFGKLIVRPGIMLRNYRWRAHQFGDEIVNNSKWVVQPEMMARIKFNKDKNFRFDYNLESSFAQADQFANRLRLQNFNNVYMGNEDLENEMYHQLNATYRTRHYASEINFNFGFNFSSRIESIRPATQIEGIDFVSTSILTDLPENTYSGNVGLNRSLGRMLSLNISTTATFSDYARILNEEQVGFNSNNYSYRIGLSFSRPSIIYDDGDNYPVIRLNWQHSITRTSSDNQNNQDFQQLTPNLTLRWRFLEDFILTGDYRYTFFDNQTTGNTNTFEIANASLFYQEEGSAWGFGIDAMNILNVGFRRNNRMSEFMVSDSRTFIQPRIILLKVSYHL